MQDSLRYRLQRRRGAGIAGGRERRTGSRIAGRPWICVERPAFPPGQPLSRRSPSRPPSRLTRPRFPRLRRSCQRRRNGHPVCVTVLDRPANPKKWLATSRWPWRTTRGIFPSGATCADLPASGHIDAPLRLRRFHAGYESGARSDLRLEGRDHRVRHEIRPAAVPYRRDRREG